MKCFEQFFRIEGEKGLCVLIAGHRRQTIPYNGQGLRGCTATQFKLVCLEATGDMLIEFMAEFLARFRFQLTVSANLWR